MMTAPLTTLADALTGLKFTLSLQRVFRRPLTPDRALEIFRYRLERREADFLALAQRAIYSNPMSPYRELLRLAGCEYGDLEGLVRREGLDGALLKLYRQGVYLTIDEFKGREPAVRGSASLHILPSALTNPNSVVHIMMQSSGSRGPRRTAPFDLAFIRDMGVDRLLVQAARGGLDWARAIWFTPGGTPLWYIIVCGMMGIRPERWFSQVDPAATGLDPRYRWSGRALRWGGRLAGAWVPAVEYAPVDAPLTIAHWMRQCLAEGRTPQLDTYPSSAARLCRAAQMAGIELRGAQFELAGEPVTDALRAVILASGAELTVAYGSMETAAVAYSCYRPQASDDSHFLSDNFGLVQPGPESGVSDLPATALLVTTLRRTAPFIFLNVSMGDVAEVAATPCGCPLEQLGLKTHLRNIRSFEKLTAFGMTFFDTDVIPILEKHLPARFGGGPTDYQVLETQDADGRTRISLLVHPSVGPLDPDKVADAFLKMLGDGRGAKRVMELQWRLAGLLQVERRPPLATASGKILHLHQARK
jgi:hypothetical protein